MQLNLAAAGNADENINLINPRFMAEALRQLRGYDVGVLANTFYTATSPNGLTRVSNDDFEWKLTATSVLDIAVGRGMATAYGYDIQSEQTIHLRGTAPSAGQKYLFIYLEWDLSNPVEAKGKIDIHDNGASATWSPRQDNLILNPIGVYQMPLHVLLVNTAGVVIGRQPGSGFIKKIGYPLRSEHASHTEEADHATKADTSKNYDTTTGNIKTKFDDVDERLTRLGFKTGTASGCASGSLKKLGNFVVADLTFSLGSTDLGTIPEGFRPYTTHIVNTYVRGYNTTTHLYTYNPVQITFNTNGTIVASAANNFDESKTIMVGWDTTAGSYQ